MTKIIPPAGETCYTTGKSSDQGVSFVMAISKGCPGAINSRDVRPDDIDCPFCGVQVEIWSDEPFATCPNCGREVTQSRGASCVDWCASARECVGSEKYERLMRMLDNLAQAGGDV